MNNRYLVDGHWLEALRIEPRQSGLPSIVLLHEGLGSVRHWKSFPMQLAEATGAEIFVYSRFGHGESDPLQGPGTVTYMHHEAHVALPEILRQAGIERPVLLGHSDGASIAILYAGMFPDSPAGLILEAPHVFVEEVTVSGIADARLQYEQTDLPKRLARHHANPDSLFRGWNDIWLDPRFREWNIESYLDSIRCPVLAIQGADDQYGTLRQIEAIQRRIPGAATLLLDHCKHAPHKDRLDAVLSAIGDFLLVVNNCQRAGRP